VVITDYLMDSIEHEKQLVESAGFKLLNYQCQNEAELISICKDADGIINDRIQITRKVIESLEHCKVIARYGIGVNSIDVEAATEKGICVVNVPDYCIEEVSDHALGLLLACVRKIVFLNNRVKNGQWDYNQAKPMHRIKGRTLGLIGFGNISKALVLKARPLGLKFLAYDPYVQKVEAESLGVELVPLQKVLAESEFISIHTPLTKETHHLIGEKEFAVMKDGVVIINTARGPAIDEEALIKALKQGKVSAAGLDVVEREPISKDSPLLALENVIINPHVAWYSEEAEVEMQIEAAKGVIKVLQGFYPKNLVNKEVKPRFKLNKNINHEGQER